MAITTRFDYGTILIGDEIIYRGLNQQQAYALKNEFGMSWNSQDNATRTAVKNQADKMKADSFIVPPGMPKCEVDPPCPWPKNGDYLENDNFMPIIVANEASTTYDFKVYQQTGSASTGYKVGNILGEYGLDQSELDPSIQSKFLYYKLSSNVTGTGNAIIVVKKYKNGTLQNTFTYLFNLIPG